MINIEPVYPTFTPPAAGKTHHFGRLVGASTASVCAKIMQQNSGVIIMITADMQSAQRLHEEIKIFTNKAATLFTDWETLPYDRFSPDKSTVSARLMQLYQLSISKPANIIIPIHVLMQRVCPPAFLHNSAFLVKQGERLRREKLCEQLSNAGYQSVMQVIEPGEFVLRGSLLDLFPLGSNTPYRLDFFDDEISSLRTFDVDTQLTATAVDRIELLPAHEFPTDKGGIETFRSQWRAQLPMRREPEHLYQQVSKRLMPAGIEYWQPLFFNQPLSTLFDYLPANALLVTLDDLHTAATQFSQEIKQRYDERNIDSMRPLLPPQQLWLSVSELFAACKRFAKMALSVDAIVKEGSMAKNLPYAPLPDLKIMAKQAEPLAKLRDFCQRFTGTTIFSVESEGRREVLQTLLHKINITPQRIELFQQANREGIYLTIGAAEKGFIDQQINCAFICEADLFGEQSKRHARQQKQRATLNADLLVRHLAELSIGQPVVHIQHGIGRYQGLVTLETNGNQAEYLLIAYADDAKIYVPVAALPAISRYACDAEQSVALHKLGSDSWQRARKKAAEKIRDIAAELLNIYSLRAAKPGFSFQANEEEYLQFCDQFAFEPTLDQELAITAVIDDMLQPKAMDRLICGDVGFGKTEVAMRAAFIAVNTHKQVAVLVPTTLLAQQHFDNFCDRFANWPVRIEMISRFRQAKTQQQILLDTAAGKVDILIGTHKLLQASVKWHDLGLLIVDEEHRFGVQHKDRMKALRADIDILTLTATPIPRTLNMALHHIRDLSIIGTPPARRLSVKTFVREYDQALIKEAIMREVLRGGQIFYVFNDVSTIEATAQRLVELIPNLRIAVAHGQMRGRDLERVMNDFLHQRSHVLICTTIIETGIDIQNANTIIIERADCFGLAQLHQLRGRVGRSHHQAYAYLLTPPVNHLNRDAQKRLEAIASLEALGSGFALASQDLEIRGAGELLGAQQSGQMAAIGFSLYMELLEKAVKSLQAGEIFNVDLLTKPQVEIELNMPLLLPETFIEDVNIRLIFYKKIASADSKSALQQLMIELADRFGPLPEAAHHLLRVAGIRLEADKLAVKRVEMHTGGGIIELYEQHKVDPTRIIALLKQDPTQYYLAGPHKLGCKYNLSDRKKRLEYVEHILTMIS